MKREYAEQIAKLLNSRNQLIVRYDIDKILSTAGNFLYEIEGNTIIACIEVKKIQWYQWEVCHLTVDAQYEGKGLGSKMIQEAEKRAKENGAKILQCTIRIDNEKSRHAFEKNGYTKTLEFYNPGSGNKVGVWQKAISSAQIPMPPSPLELVRQFWALMASNDFGSVGSVLSDDFVLEWPQSNERIRGRATFAAMNEEYPAHGPWRFTLNRLVGSESEAVSDVFVTDGVQCARAISFFTIVEGQITKIVEFWPDPFEAPANRSHLVERMD